MNIVLCTINPSIELAWREALVGFPALHPLCEILTGNITELAVDAVVSPANSFGFMDGGIDLHYSTVFGWHVQERLQAFIKTMAVQELPVGEAVAVETGHGRIKYVIAAPTMRTPCVLRDPQPVYLAARAATVSASRGGIETLAFPGMGMGTGRLPFGAAARAMLEGINDGLFPKPFPKSLRDVMEGPRKHKPLEYVQAEAGEIGASPTGPAVRRRTTTPHDAVIIVQGFRLRLRS